MLCGKCARICPTNAIDYLQQEREFTIESRAAVLTTGFGVTPLEDKPQFGSGRLPNVITALQMERLLAPHGPYNRVLRPSDGKQPDSISYFQCAASRDETTGIPYCSRVCCMYAIKQAMLLSGSLPLADITVYYMDIRAFGKGYEQFYQNASAMGIQFVKTRPEITGTNGEGNILVRYEAQEEDGRIVTAEHDLVVLSLGLVPAWSPAGKCVVSTGSDGFIHTVSPKLSPTLTEMDGVFTAGAACGPKDIADTISEAGAAAMQASNYLSAHAEKPAA
jgi:heterodisulfide reductase subunit A